MTLLSVEELRRLVTSSLEDDDLQTYLDAAEQAIDARYGPIGSPLSEIVDGSLSYIFLRRRAESIVSVTETDGTVDTELDEDDFRLRADGVSLLRLRTGTNYRAEWGAPVTVSYIPADDEASRKITQLAIVQLDMDHEPGGVSETIGSWQETKASNSVWNYEKERASILDSMGAAVSVWPGFA